VINPSLPEIGEAADFLMTWPVQAGCRTCAALTPSSRHPGLAVALEHVTVQARYAGAVDPIYSRLLNVNLNLVTPLRVLQQALPLLNAEGCVINIGSTARCFCRVDSIGCTVTKAAGLKVAEVLHTALRQAAHLLFPQLSATR
jgi:hypothetical protein